MVNKLRLGILGYANIAKKSMIDNFIGSDEFILSKIGSRKNDKLKEVIEKYNTKGVLGYEEVVNDPKIDCIYIPLPTGLHFEWAKECILSGKHVMIEKSICTSLKETRELIKLSELKNVCVFENFMFQYNDQYKVIHELLKEGTIGDIKLLKSSFGFPIFDPQTNIRYKRDLGGGALLDAGAYVLKGSQFLAGINQKVVSSRMVMHKEYNVDFHGYVTLESENGLVSQLSYGFDNYYQNMIEIWGSKGIIKTERAYTSPSNFEHIITISNNNESKDIVVNSSNPGITICKKFAESIKSKDLSENQKILRQAQLIHLVKSKSKG